MRLNKQITSGVFFLVGILLASSFVLPAYSGSSPQFAPPGAGSFDYLNRQGFDLAPVFGEESCNAGQDFIIQIPPFGCTPAVVRSDLLEEQNVPVFCQLAATKINPLIEVESIDSLSFKGTYPDSVQGVGFHPARAAVKSSQRTLLNSPILQNIGYAVIVLKQQKNESAMPDFVTGDLTANIRYDIKNAFGIGRATQYLPEFTEEEWSQNFKQYGFWDGRAFLRAEAIEADGAVISIYLDENNKLSTSNLGLGKTSNNIFLPGFTCLAGLQLRLDGLKDPNTRARLNINGEIVQVSKGERFLDNKCVLRGDPEKRGLNEEVTISCLTDEGNEKFKLSISPKIKIEINGESKEVGIGDFLYDGSNGKFVYVGYIGTKGNAKDSESLFMYLSSRPTKVGSLSDSDLASISRIVTRLRSLQPEEIKRISSVPAIGAVVGIINKYIGILNYAKACIVDGKCLYPITSLNEEETYLEGRIKLVGFSTPVNQEFKEKSFKINFDNAMKDYRRIISSFPNEKERSDDQQTFGQKALFESIKLAYGAQQMRTASDLCKEFEERYPDDGKLVTKFCEDEAKHSNEGVAEHSVFVNGRVKEISLEGIYEPSLDEFSAEILVRNKDGILSTVVLTKGFPEYISENEFLQLEKLDTNSAKIRMNLVSSGTFEIVRKVFVPDTGNLKLNEPKGFGSSYVFTLQKVNLKKVAKVSVIPNIKNAGTEANFSFNIGIEKRGIQLSPEKTKERIRTLDESIGKWEGRSEKLGKAVRVFNAACLAVGTTLTIKNLIDDFDGRAIARQEVMRSDGGWYDTCKKLVTNKDYTSVDTCLLDKSPEIDRDVEIVEGIIKDQEAITNDNLCRKLIDIRAKLGGSVTDPRNKEKTIKISKGENIYAAFDKDAKTNKCEKISLTEARDLERLNSILDSSVSDGIKRASEIKGYRILSDINVNAENFAIHNSLQKQLNDAGFGKLEVESFGKDSAIKAKYNGATVFGSEINGVVGLKPNEKYSTKIITLSSVRYLLILDGTGSEYSIGNNGEHVYRLDNIKKNIITVSSADDDEKKIVRERFSGFTRTDTVKYNNEFKNPEVRYFETEPYKGLPAIVPFDVQNGWYVAMKQIWPGAGALRDSSIRAYYDSGQVTNFNLCNVGPNGKEEFNSLSTRDDECMGFNPNSYSVSQTFPGLDATQTKKKVKDAQLAIQQASKQHKSGVKEVRILGNTVRVGNPEIGTPDIQCQDFMSPEDCNILFNACDPVVCPSSRCDFGGEFPVSDVIQSGIIGSTLLCLPNYQEDIYVPICLTGIKAGVDSFVSVQQSYRDCLQTNLDTGETVGICDEIHSIYLCDFFWSQTLPLSQVLIPKALEYVTGQTGRGGGEYLGVSTAWKNAGDSVDYMTNYYGASSFEAFKTGIVKEIGHKVCENFISVSYPDVDFLDSILEPESPPQYTAWFSERTFSTATVPPTSQYKVFYHIFAGKNEGAYYNVRLKNPSGTSFFATNPTINIANGFIPKGDFVSETPDFIGVAGYRELCVSVNGQEECGFNQVSTDFGLDYLQGQYVKEQAEQTDIKTENECLSGTPSLYGLANPNLQAGIEGFVNPTLYNTQLVRVCSTSNPGQGTDFRAGAEGGRWLEVGTCDGGIGNLKCYLDRNSVEDSIEFQSIANATLQKIEDEVFAKIRNGSNFIKIGEELIKIDKFDAAGKVKYITQGLIDKAFFSKEKAQLIFIRGKAYAELALSFVKKELDDLAVKQVIAAISSIVGFGDPDDWDIDDYVPDKGVNPFGGVSELPDKNFPGEDAGVVGGGQAGTVGTSAEVLPLTAGQFDSKLNEYVEVILRLNNELIRGKLLKISDGKYSLTGEKGVHKFSLSEARQISRPYKTRFIGKDLFVFGSDDYWHPSTKEINDHWEGILGFGPLLGEVEADLTHFFLETGNLEDIKTEGTISKKPDATPAKPIVSEIPYTKQVSPENLKKIGSLKEAVDALTKMIEKYNGEGVNPGSVSYTTHKDFRDLVEDINKNGLIFENEYKVYKLGGNSVSLPNLMKLLRTRMNREIAKGQPDYSIKSVTFLRYEGKMRLTVESSHCFETKFDILSQDTFLGFDFLNPDSSILKGDLTVSIKNFELNIFVPGKKYYAVVRCFNNLKRIAVEKDTLPAILVKEAEKKTSEIATKIYPTTVKSLSEAIVLLDKFEKDLESNNRVPSSVYYLTSTKYPFKDFTVLVDTFYNNKLLTLEEYEMVKRGSISSYNVPLLKIYLENKELIEVAKGSELIPPTKTVSEIADKCIESAEWMDTSYETIDTSDSISPGRIFIKLNINSIDACKGYTLDTYHPTSLGGNAGTYKLDDSKVVRRFSNKGGGYFLVVDVEMIENYYPWPLPNTYSENKYNFKIKNSTNEEVLGGKTLNVYSIWRKFTG